MSNLPFMLVIEAPTSFFSEERVLSYPAYKRPKYLPISKSVFTLSTTSFHTFKFLAITKSHREIINIHKYTNEYKNLTFKNIIFGEQSIDREHMHARKQTSSIKLLLS